MNSNTAENVPYALTQAQLDSIYNEQLQMIRTLSQREPNEEDHVLCMKWLEALNKSSKPDIYVHNLLMLMQQQLNAEGQLGLPFNESAKHQCKLKDVTTEIMSEADNVCHSDASDYHRQLKNEQAVLKRKINELELRITALNIENNYEDQLMHELGEVNIQKACFHQSLFQNLLASCQKALDNQQSDNFPHQLLTQVFELFGDDPVFMKQIKEADAELVKVVPKLCTHSCEAERAMFQAVAKSKLKAAREKIVIKYEEKLTKQQPREKTTLLTVKRRCFDLVRQFLEHFNSQEDESDKEYVKTYLQQLEQLYDEETEKF